MSEPLKSEIWQNPSEELLKLLRTEEDTTDFYRSQQERIKQFQEKLDDDARKPPDCE